MHTTVALSGACQYKGRTAAAAADCFQRPLIPRARFQQRQRFGPAGGRDTAKIGRDPGHRTTEPVPDRPSRPAGTRPSLASPACHDEAGVGPHPRWQAMGHRVRFWGGVGLDRVARPEAWRSVPTGRRGKPPRHAETPSHTTTNGPRPGAPPKPEPTRPSRPRDPAWSPAPGRPADIGSEGAAPRPSPGTPEAPAKTRRLVASAGAKHRLGADRPQRPVVGRRAALGGDGGSRRALGTAIVVDEAVFYRFKINAAAANEE